MKIDLELRLLQKTTVSVLSYKAYHQVVNIYLCISDVSVLFLAPEYDSHVMWATYVKSSVCFARDIIYV